MYKYRTLLQNNLHKSKNVPNIKCLNRNTFKFKKKLLLPSYSSVVLPRHLLSN